MKSEELFKQLHFLYRWGENATKNLTVEEYEGLSPAEGLAKARKDHEGAKWGQKNCHSDMAYWMWDKSIGLYAVMVAVFEKLVENPDFDFPELRISEGALMDFNSDITEYARKLHGLKV